MASPETIIAAHYQAVRDEIALRLRSRDQYVLWLVTGSVGALALYLRNEAWWGLLFGLPFFVLVVAVHYAHTDTMIGSLSQWLRERHSQVLHQYAAANEVSFSFGHWDESAGITRYTRGSLFLTRYLSLAAMFFVVNAVALSIVWRRVDAAFGGWCGVAHIALVILTVLGVGIPALTWWGRLRRIPRE